MNIQQDQVVPGRVDALAKAVLDWHNSECTACGADGTWSSPCPTGAHLWFTWWSFPNNREALHQGGTAW